MILLLLMYLQAPSSWVNELWIVQGSWNGVTDIHPWIDTTQTTHLSANNCFTPTYISLHPHHRHFTADNTVHFRPDRHANISIQDYCRRSHSHSDTRPVHKGKCRKKSWTTRNEPTTADSHSGRKSRRRRTEWNILGSLGRISRTKQEAVVRWRVSGDGARGDGLC